MLVWIFNLFLVTEQSCFCKKALPRQVDNRHSSQTAPIQRHWRSPVGQGGLIADRHEGVDTFLAGQLVIDFDLFGIKGTVTHLDFNECRPLGVPADDADDSIGANGLERRVSALEAHFGVTRDATARSARSTNHDSPKLGYRSHHSQQG